MKACAYFLMCLLVLYCTNTAFATIYKWKPATGTSAKNKANWRTSCGTAGTVFPSLADTLEYNGSCSDANCVLDTTFNVAMIHVKSNYSGSITVSGSITLTFAEGLFLGGTFNGGSIPLIFTESLRINGTGFTSTSGLLSIAGDFTYNGSSFTHNSGTVLFKKGSATTTVFSGTSNAGTTLTLYKAEFAAASANTQFMIRNITVRIENEVKLSGNYQLFLNTNTSSTVEVQGNIISSNTASVGGGTVLLLVNGTGTQTINDNQGASISGKLPNIKINKASGTLSLYGTIGMGGSTTLEYVAGTINANTSRLLCYYNNTLYNNSGGSVPVSKIEFIGGGGTHTVTGKIMATDTFSTSGSGNCIINGDTLELQGNMVWNNTSSGSGGNVVYKFSGSSEQFISGTVTVPLSKARLHKTSGDISLLTSVNITTDLKFETGYIVSDTVNMVIFNHGASATGASNNSFVKGAVKKIGNSTFTFPLGKDTIYNPLSITSPSNTTDAFTAEFFNIVQPYGLEQDSLTYVSLCEYWNLQRTTGTSNVKVTLNWKEHSCDINTLSTLRIARWDGAKWTNTGPVTTTGNNTEGTIQSNSNLSFFGSFAIAKRSPAVYANAGNDTTINLGGTASLGGSPSATGGVSPYSYLWIPDYALSSNSVANPTASPFSTTTYYLKITDTDESVDFDTIVVTVNGFDLKTANRFPLLTGDTLRVTNPTRIVGAVGAKRQIVGSVEATDSILINSSTSNLASRHLDTAMTKIDALTASTISTELGGNTYTAGVYRISGNATLTGTLTLNGDEQSFFVFDINGSFSIASGGSIALTGGVSSDQVFFNVNSNITVAGNTSVLYGKMLGRGSFIGNISSGSVWIQVGGLLNGSIESALKLIFSPEIVEGSLREIDDYLGYNGAVVIQDFGWGTEELPATTVGLPELLPQLHSSTFRYPGGSDATWWRWQAGWFRGYNNPLYNDLFNPNNSDVKYYDPYPLPENASAGISPDKNVLQPWPNDLLDFKKSIDATASIPLYDLNVVTSDIGTEIGSLFYAHCNGLPVKYIELGNEIYSTDQDKIDKYGTAAEYVELIDADAGRIKEYFPDVKIGINASVTTDVDLDGRRNYWNDAIEEYANVNEINFDALTFHIYPQLELPTNAFCDFSEYANDPGELTKNLFTTPFKKYYDMSLSTDPQKELSLCEYNPEGSLEAWITEYSEVDPNFDVVGTWAQGLFVNAMTLAPLDYKGVTKVICYAMSSGARYSVLFDTDNGFAGVAKCSTPPGSTEQWSLGAVGKGLQYIALATKQAYQGQKINFPGCEQLESADPENDYKTEGITGWIFDCYRGYDANNEWIGDRMAVITNLTGTDQEMYTNELFPNGGTYFIMVQKEEENELPSPLRFINDSENQIIETSGDFAGGGLTKITIPKYSIILIKETKLLLATPIHLEASSMTQCIGKEVTIYLSGAEDYYISPPSDQGSIVTGPTVTVHPMNDVTYKVWKIPPPTYQGSISIDISIIPVTSISETSGTPCEGQENELDASPSNFYYNWYPYEETMPSNNEETVSVFPEVSTEYTVNLTNHICYCGTASYEVEKYPKADAGPDIVICEDALAPPTLGSTEVYPVGSTFLWTPASALNNPNDDDIQNPLIAVVNDASNIVTFEVTYPNCPVSTDDALVDVVNCCEGGYDPYPELDYEFGNNFLAR